jgi:hypothetical protein
MNLVADPDLLCLVTFLRVFNRPGSPSERHCHKGTNQSLCSAYHHAARSVPGDAASNGPNGGQAAAYMRGMYSRLFSTCNEGESVKFLHKF